MSKRSDFTILGAFTTKTLKNTSVSLAMSVCLPIRQSVRKNPRTAEQIFMTFGTGEFH
jgi:hypothetical protein